MFIRLAIDDQVWTEELTIWDNVTARVTEKIKLCLFTFLRRFFLNLDFEQNATVKVLSKKEEVKAEINLKTSKEVINDTNAIEIKQTGKFDVVVELDGQQQQHGYPIEIVSQSLIEQTFLFIIYDKTARTYGI